jgi:hypothetical protein
MTAGRVQGLIALILAVTIALVLVIGVVAAAIQGRAMSEGAREVLVALGGAIVGALAGFLGSKALNGKA